ncbi:MAG TPA: HNH endonuclease signature motif containing protein [Urbifossiella sp.]|nr:HNH endonuclease signature motif containing protein [Urbifossiella sp.]
MSDRIAPALVRLVRERAGGFCEYCRLPQWSQEATFHMDHIQPSADGGLTEADNLALACVTCSLRKGARTLVRDPKTHVLVPLFHPRRESWERHFRWTRAWRLMGRTATGRATITALSMNREAIVRIRRLWAEAGEFP